MSEVKKGNVEWVPVTEALPPVGHYVIVTTAPRRGSRNLNRAWIDVDGIWHGYGTFAKVVAWTDIEPWEGQDADPVRR